MLSFPSNQRRYDGFPVPSFLPYSRGLDPVRLSTRLAHLQTKLRKALEEISTTSIPLILFSTVDSIDEVSVHGLFETACSKI